MDEIFEKVKLRFPYISDERIMGLLSLCETIFVKAGDVFIEAGTKTNKTALVLRGLMRNYVINSKGEQVTVMFATELEPITAYSAFFLNKAATETSEAIEDSILLTMNLHEFTKLAEEHHDYSRLYGDILRNNLLDAIDRIEDFTIRKPEERYLRLMDKNAELLERVPLKILASYLGITPVSLSRIRKRVVGKRN